MRLLGAWKHWVVRRGRCRGLATGLSVRQVAKGVAAILILAGLLSLLQRRECWSSLRRLLLLLLLGSRRVGGLAVAVAVSVPIRVLLVLVGIHTAYGTGGGSRWWSLRRGHSSVFTQCCTAFIGKASRLVKCCGEFSADVAAVQMKKARAHRVVVDTK